MSDLPNMDDPDNLELWNPVTGETRDVVPDKKEWPTKKGNFGLMKATPDGWTCFNTEGRHIYGQSAWQIRNKPKPAAPLPEPVLTYLRTRAAGGDADAAKLLPVDPLLIEARKIAAEQAQYDEAEFIGGLRDHEWLVSTIFLGLKRRCELCKGEGA